MEGGRGLGPVAEIKALAHLFGGARAMLRTNPVGIAAKTDLSILDLATGQSPWGASPVARPRDVMRARWPAALRDGVDVPQALMDLTHRVQAVVA